MEIDISAAGEIVESQELLNGTRTVAFEGASEDGWLVSGVASWNRGLVDYVGEGDLTVARENGTEIYASLTQASIAREEDANADVSLDCRYEVDGGAGEYDGASGSATGSIVIEGDAIRGKWRIQVASP